TDSPPPPPTLTLPALGSTPARISESSARRFDRTASNSRRGRGTTTTTTTTITRAAAGFAAKNSDQCHLASDTAEFTFRAAAAFPSLQDPPLQSQSQSQSRRREFVGGALLPSLSRRATISEQKPGLRPMLDRNASVGSSSSSSEAGTCAAQRQASLSTDQMSVDSAHATLAPTSRGAYETPNDNENDGLYAAEFWVTALVPKPHTNFFGYEAAIGPICVSISTRESHECYKALVRTPLKFGVVYVPTMVIDEPVFGTDLDRLSSATPQKMLLYHALRLFFQQADDERRGYLLTALRNRQLAQDSAA
ncbi:hypothetical protein GGF44_004160, partial [Coemansia sp. RSA 1694]